MSPIYEKLKTQIAELPDDEQYDLYADLRERFEPDIEGEPTAVSLSDEWRNEIESRLSDVMHGRVRLVPGDEVDREVDSFFARHNLKRLKHQA